MLEEKVDEGTAGVLAERNAVEEVAFSRLELSVDEAAWLEYGCGKIEMTREAFRKIGLKESGGGIRVSESLFKELVVRLVDRVCGHRAGAQHRVRLGGKRLFGSSHLQDARQVPAE